jgi:hypothetical protein
MDKTRGSIYRKEVKKVKEGGRISTLPFGIVA